MAVYELLENGKPVMVVAGLDDPERFLEEARQSGHLTEELRPLVIGDCVLTETVELTTNSDH